jgi:hypothetical protein
MSQIFRMTGELTFPDKWNDVPRFADGVKGLDRVSGGVAALDTVCDSAMLCYPGMSWRSCPLLVLISLP